MARRKDDDTQTETDSAMGDVMATEYGSPDIQTEPNEATVFEGEPINDMDSGTRTESYPVDRPAMPRMDRGNIPIRDMSGLNTAQRRMLLEDMMKGVLSREMVPSIPTVIYYSNDTYGLNRAVALVEVDVRLMEEAWNVYKTNSDKPTYQDFMDIVQSVKGKRESRLYPRVGVMDLTKWA